MTLKPKTPTSELGIGPVEGEEYSFEEKVEAETAALELIVKGSQPEDIEKNVDKAVSKPDTDEPVVRQKGQILPIAFKKEVTDMAKDVLIRLHGMSIGDTLTLKNSGITISGYINSEGSIIIEWKGLTKTS
jgi:hypothetical protein